MNNAGKNLIRAAKELTKELQPDEVKNVLQALAAWLDDGEVMEMSAKEFAVFAVFLFGYDEFVAGGE